jgi:hypothetical protein
MGAGTGARVRGEQASRIQFHEEATPSRLGPSPSSPSLKKKLFQDQNKLLYIPFWFIQNAK